MFLTPISQIPRVPQFTRIPESIRNSPMPKMFPKYKPPQTKCPTISEFAKLGKCPNQNFPNSRKYEVPMVPIFATSTKSARNTQFPKKSEIYKRWTCSRFPQVPQCPTFRKFHENPERAQLHKMSKMSKMPQTRQTPNLSEIPRSPKVTKVAQIPKVPPKQKIEI